ncbi:5346_t:CDS:2 [Diversispora eburnea]|uniref:5346_t:CDS:1 n=1 Tax=Diversispora eburnea TaxID=1213867 RepID=A0A9N8YKH2_9GLOM|nr:5346_t:CDS:2 [Diversispora eburnea]
MAGNKAGRRINYARYSRISKPNSVYMCDLIEIPYDEQNLLENETFRMQTWEPDLEIKVENPNLKAKEPDLERKFENLNLKAKEPVHEQYPENVSADPDLERFAVFCYIIDDDWEDGEEQAKNAIAYSHLLESKNLDASKGTHILLVHGEIVRYGEEITSVEYNQLAEDYPRMYYVPIVRKIVRVRNQ